MNKGRHKCYLHVILKADGRANILFSADIAVSEISFIHMLLDGQEGLLQHREGTA